MEKLLEMANEGEFVAGASSSSIVKRIFIGGLDASVTAADIERTFSSLGRVHNIEFVRTDLRSFGFMDFEPKSDKDLSKLFAVVSHLHIFILFFLCFFNLESPMLGLKVSSS